MECHKCEHRAAVAAGKYRHVAFELTPCSRCELHESSMGVLEYEDTQPAPAVEKTSAMDLSSLSNDDLQRWVFGLLTLPRGAWDVVVLRLRGFSWVEIAKRMKSTECSVQRRWRRSAQKLPALRAAFRGVVPVRRRRRDRLRQETEAERGKTGAISGGEQGTLPGRRVGRKLT